MIPIGQHLSVNEQIVPYKDRIGLKQYNSKKPTKWGYKLFCLAGASGIVYDFEVYCGSMEQPQNLSDISASGNVVIRLAERIPKNQNYLLSYDNWFCSPELQIQLARNGIHSVDTITNQPRPTTSRKTPFLPRIDYRRRQKGSNLDYIDRINHQVIRDQGLDRYRTARTRSERNEIGKRSVEKSDKRTGGKDCQFRKRSEKKNLIIKGMPDEEEEDAEETKKRIVRLCETLGVDIKPEVDVDEVRRLGKPAAGRQRPVLLKMTTSNKKMEILRSAKQLKGTNIWIDEDYPKGYPRGAKTPDPEIKRG
ncbi:hypothetical protein NQ318_012468 [Aromia moschata]|uniref:PiggyBac transposable element-derived protein domain-containing protein n=1 Tax=Aromia moschata TaxID=1265417 RepID=A0AAV8X6T0_9CUCU|nr:hypothetical protein NQ318_012468 [Aromia moschata]